MDTRRQVAADFEKLDRSTPAYAGAQAELPDNRDFHADGNRAGAGVPDDERQRAQRSGERLTDGNRTMRKRPILVA